MVPENVQRLGFSLILQKLTKIHTVVDLQGEGGLREILGEERGERSRVRSETKVWASRGTVGGYGGYHGFDHLVNHFFVIW